MGISLVLAIIAGFFAGFLVATIISIAIYTSQQKKLEKIAEDRHFVISSIGKLCATVDNAFSAYRIGTLKYESLRDVLLSKIEEINTALKSNIDNLDSFYVKNIERFIEDQKAFLMRSQDETQASFPRRSVRDISKAKYQETDEFTQRAPSPIIPIPTPSPPLPSFTPPPEKAVDEISLEDTFQKTEDVAVAEKPLELDKTVEIEKPKPPETVEKEKPSYHEEALSAFELGATTRIPLDAIKQYQESEETVSVDKMQVQEEVDISPIIQKVTKDEHPEKGQPVFETASDAEATQQYDVEDLFEKKESRFAPTPTKERPAFQPGAPFVAPGQKKGEADDVFEVDIPGKPAPGKTSPQAKKGSEDDSLITGEDVMDQMDNFFGISE